MPAVDLPLPFALPAPLDGPNRAPVAAAPHLILPYAAAENALAVATPQLDALALLQETERDGQEYDFPIPPHERAVAQAWGLNAWPPPPGRRWARQQGCPMPGSRPATCTPGLTRCGWTTRRSCSSP